MQGGEGKLLPTLHTTVDSGISSDACKGLTKQGTNDLQDMETASPFFPFLFGLLSGTSLDVWQRCSLPTEGDSTNTPFQTPAHPKDQTYTCGCVSEFQKFP